MSDEQPTRDVDTPAIIAAREALAADDPNDERWDRSAHPLREALEPLLAEYIEQRQLLLQVIENLPTLVEGHTRQWRKLVEMGNEHERKYHGCYGNTPNGQEVEPR